MTALVLSGRRRPPAPAGPLEPKVRVSGYAYLADFGRGAPRRLHTVYKDRTCSCNRPACPAIQAVAEGLASGQLERAPDPPPGYTAFLPRICPICGQAVAGEPQLSSRRRGLGWRCLSGGARHYWLHQWEAVRGWFFRPDLLPTVRRGELATGRPFGYLPECNREDGGQP